MIACGSSMVIRIIAKRGDAIQLVVHIKTSGKYTEPSFELVFDPVEHGGHMPVVAVLIPKGAAVTRTGNETTRLIGKRIIRLVFKWAQRRGTYENAVGVYIPLCARCGVLIVVLAVVLSHPWTLRIGHDQRVGVIFSKPFPPVLFRVQPQNFLNIADRGIVV